MAHMNVQEKESHDGEPIRLDLPSQEHSSVPVRLGRPSRVHTHTITDGLVILVNFPVT